MLEKENKELFRKMYDDDETSSSLLGEWLLTNSDDSEFDTMMLELLDSTEYFDPVSSSHGYSRFKKNLKNYQSRCRRDTLKRIVRGIERVAAILLLPVSILMFYAGGTTTEVEWLEANTSSGQKMEVILPDGSGLTLGPSSKLIYPSVFNGNERKVFLIGSAYADVVTDSKRPFIMSSGNLDVRVYGTEFQIHSYENDSEVEVALVEGSVSLHNKLDKRDVTMRPGDIVCYDKSTGNFIRKNFAAGYYKDILENGGFQFVNQRLGDIASCLERHFGVTIHIDDDGVRDERYFASFINNENVDEILNVLNAQNYMEISRKGKTITITRRNN